MKRILITGITGFVGMNLVNYLKFHSEVQLFGYSRDIDKAKSRLNEIKFLPEISAALLDRYRIDTVVHLAGIAHDLSRQHNKEDYQKVNFKWTLELYEEFLKSRASTFVFVSSIKAVTEYSERVIDENHFKDPSSDYGISKKMAEDYLLKHQESDKDTFILKPVMIHGPGNKGNLNLLYKFVRKGLPYPLAAFENLRSFLSIENFCFVINEIIHDRLDQGEYLLADSESISTTDLVKIIGNTLNTSVLLFKIPKSIVMGLAKMGSLMNTPFNTQSLAKLVQNLSVSNKKLLVNLGKDLPVSTREGLIHTIKSFDE